MSNVSSSNSQGVRVPKLRFPGFEGEWESAKLSDLTTYLRTRRKSCKSHFISTENMHQNCSGIEQYEDDSIVDGIAFEKGDLLLANIRPYLKKLWLSSFSGVCSTDVLAFHPIDVDSDFLYSALCRDSFFTYVMSGVKGSKMPRGDKSHIMDFQLAVPRKQEQEKVASFVQQLDTRIEKQRQFVEALKSYKRGLLSKLFPQKGETTPRYRFVGFTDPWKQRKIKELFKITRGYVLAASMTTDKQTESTPYPVYSSQTKNDGLMGYYNQYLYENAITWTTDGANAGTVNFRNGKFYCTNVCGVLLADTVDPDQMISQALNSVAKNHVSYVGNPKLMNNVMAEITIALPESEKERQVISSILSYYDNLISSHMQKLDGLQSLKAGLLQQLFI